MLFVECRANEEPGSEFPGLEVLAEIAPGVGGMGRVFLAREESLELGEAVRFAGSKFLANLSSLLVVLAAAGGFYLVLNATLAGGITRVLGGFGSRLRPEPVPLGFEPGEIDDLWGAQEE